MKKAFFFILIVGLQLISCKNETKSTEINTIKHKIDVLAQKYFELKRFSGSIVVVKDNSVIYNDHFGLADYENSRPFSNNTVFKIGTISEVITRNIIESLHQDNKLKLNDRITKYIPEFKEKYTIEDILNYKVNFSSVKAISKKYPKLNYDTITYANLANDSLLTKTNSSLNYNILGVLIEKVTSKRFEENIKDYSKRLQLKNTYLEASNSEIATGYQYHNYRNQGLELQKATPFNPDEAFSSGGLKSTPEDLMKIAAQSSDKLIDNHGFTEDDGFSYSLYKNSEHNLTIVVLSNFRQPIAKEIYNSIDSIINDKPYRLPLARQPFDIDKTLLIHYTGNYSLNEYMKFKVITRNDSLFTVLGPNEVYLVPQSNNQFYMQDRDAAMRFLKDSNNKVNRVELLDGFIDGQMATLIKD